MKVSEIMTDRVVPIGPEESAAVAARMLAHYNIGALPVCGGQGKLCGMLTDRDLVTRCLASGRLPEETRVREIMSVGVVSVTPEAEVEEAARLMGRLQIRRLPVAREGKLCGMVSLGDLAGRNESRASAAEALSRISSNISVR